MEINLSRKFGSNKKVLITGGAGFIGSAVIRKLLKDTEAKIINIDKLTYASDLTSIEKTLNALGNESKKRYSFHKIDLCDADATNKIVRQISPDIIIHLAAESHVDRSIEGPKVFLQSNIIGTFNILNAALSNYLLLSQQKKEEFIFHHVSTDEVFGSLEEDGFFNEKTAYSPRSPYSATKASSDFLVNAWFHTYGLPILITNCSNNYGPWQFPEKLIPVVINKALNNLEIPIYGDGLNIRDWLYVDDHVEALIYVICKGKIGESYCIGGNNEKTNIECVKEICSNLDRINPKSKKYENNITFIKDRLGHDKRYAIDASKIKLELGWEPKTKFSEGINLTVEWYFNNLDWVTSILNK